MYLLCIYLLLLSGSATQHISGQSPHFLGYTLSTKHNEPWLSACILIVMRETFSKYNNHLCAINMTDRLCIALYGKIRNLNCHAVLEIINVITVRKSLEKVVTFWLFGRKFKFLNFYKITHFHWAKITFWCPLHFHKQFTVS